MRAYQEMRLISRTWWTFPPISFCQWKIFVPFCLPKKRPEKAFLTNSELSRNRTEKQIMPFKTTVRWLFNDIWCYLVIDSFDWETGVYHIFKMGSCSSFIIRFWIYSFSLKKISISFCSKWFLSFFSIIFILVLSLTITPKLCNKQCSLTACNYNANYSSYYKFHAYNKIWINSENSKVTKNQRFRSFRS